MLSQPTCFEADRQSQGTRVSTDRIQEIYDHDHDLEKGAIFIFVFGSNSFSMGVLRALLR